MVKEKTVPLAFAFRCYKRYTLTSLILLTLQVISNLKQFCEYNLQSRDVLGSTHSTLSIPISFQSSYFISLRYLSEIIGSVHFY